MWYTVSKYFLKSSVICVSRISRLKYFANKLFEFSPEWISPKFYIATFLLYFWSRKSKFREARGTFRKYNMPRTQHRKKKSNRKNFKSKAKISQDKMACGEGTPTFKGSFLFLKEIPNSKSSFSEFSGAIFTQDFRKNILKVISAD